MHNDGHWPECETCTRTFRTQAACNQHMNDTDHWAPEFPCETCNKAFSSQNAANQHMNTTNHWEPRYRCQTCSAEYRAQVEANKHMDMLDHWAANYCKDCDRWFQSEANKRAVRHSLHSCITFCKAD